MASETAGQVPVAIIGMGCLFPKANDAARYWANIRDGIDAITEIPSTHWRPEDYFNADPKAPDQTYARRGGFLDPYDFAPLDFGLSPNTLEATDATQLLGLVAARQAMIDAGYGPDRQFDRSRVSVILGVTGTLELVIPLAARLGHPLWRKALDEAGVSKDVADDVVNRIGAGYVGWQEDSFPGLLGNVVAGRISNRLDLGGTNCVVDAACASSLGAVHLALLELMSGRSDMVLTGGMDTFNDIFMYMCFSKTPALSPSGDARPFAQAGDGTILGEGLGCLVLKRLADAERDGDKIYAVIKSVGSSSDGKGQAIYAPSSEGQTRALRDAYTRAGVTPETIELLEAHGTGTAAGDKAEAAALAQVYGNTEREGAWCAVGSVKSQIGHTKAAAGAAGLMKAALALHRKVLPPTIKVDKPIDTFASEESPFYVNTERRPWLPSADHPRRAAISAFGFGGSNYHCVLEEYRSDTDEIDWDGDVQILSWSAESPEKIVHSLEAWRTGLSWDGLRRKAAETRATFDSEQPYRLAIVTERRKGDVEKLVAQAIEVCRRGDARSSGPIPDGIFYHTGPVAGDLALLFPGQGAQYPGMFLDLACRFPQMRQALARANDAFDRDREKTNTQRLSDYIYPQPAFDKPAKSRHEAELKATDVAQPALGAVAVGAVHILDQFGVKPGAVAGHSYGELPSLCAAGRFDPDTLHFLSRERGRSMAEGSGDRGAMLAVLAERHTIDKVIGEDKLALVVANKNAPRQSVLSGASSEISRARESFAKRSIEVIPLSVSAAFHSPFVAEARERFSTALADVELHSTEISVYANTTGRTYPTDSNEARALLAGQLAEPVEFVSLIENMYESGYRTFLEVGPAGKLTGLVHSILSGKSISAFSLDASSGSRGGMVDLARALASLATLGHDVNLTKWDGDPDLTTPVPVRKPTLTVPLSGANYVKPKPPIPPTVRPAATPVPIQQPAPVQPPVNSNGSQKNGVHKNGDDHPATLHVHSEINGKRHIQASPAKPEARVTAPPRVVPNSTLQQGLLALQELGEQTARLHRQFLEGQDRAIQVLQNLLTQAPAHVSTLQPTPAAPPVVPRPAVASAPRIAAPAPRPVQPVQKPVKTVVAAAPAVASAPVAKATPVQPAPVRPKSNDRAQGVLLAVVAEKTGYPVEMLDLAMEIEADLGIDSIKRVEIFSAIAERLPDAPPIRAEHLGTLRTLGQVAEFLGSEEAVVVVAPQAKSTAPAQNPRVQSAATPTLLAVVAEKTGYPVEMLELGMEIEADLGIDSIKRVEIFSAIAERLPDAPPIRAEHLGTLRTLGQVAEFLGQSDSSAPSISIATPAPTAPANNSHVLSVLLDVVSEKTGYPVEMLELPMEIEADLGIDSIKRVEIFSALQERLPDSPPIKAEHLGVLRTLGQVAEFLGGSSSQQLSAEPVPARAEMVTTTRAAQSSTSLESIQRFVVLPQTIEPASRRPLAPLAPGSVVAITADDPALAQALVTRLNARGYQATLIVTGSPVPPDIAALVIAAPSTGADDAFVRRSLELVKAAGASLKHHAVTGGASLLTVSRLDGVFGLGDAGPHSLECAMSGGLAGLAKTAGLEWPEVRCRAVDIDATIADSSLIAGWLTDELCHEGPAEVGYSNSGVHTLATEERAVTIEPAGAAPLAPGDVVVVSGGARGVTAAVAESVGRKFGAKLALLGRTAAPNAEPAWLSACGDESSIKRAWIAQQGRTVAPRDVDTAYRAIAANREALANIEQMRSLGIEVSYYQVDVTKSSDVAATVERITRELGPVRGLVHGAGVLADATIETKTLESFDRVYQTKIHGLRALLSAIPASSLKTLVLFSSSTARFGRVAQVDYAMANEVMNKIADFEAKRSPNCRVLSVNWGPWDGGMVNAGLKKLFASEGVGVIPLLAGAEYLTRELATNGSRPVEVVILGTDGLPESSKAESSASGDLSFVFEREISIAAMPVLADHIIDGRVVLPMALTLELLAHAALHGHPGMALQAIESLRVNRGVIIDRDQSTVVRIFASKPVRSNNQARVVTELQSESGGRTVIHARAEVILGDRPATGNHPVSQLAGPRYGKDRSFAYKNILFHGDALQGIAEIEHCSPAGISARLTAAPAPKSWMSQPHRGSWIADPLVLDSIFQMMIVWSFERHGAGSLPCFIGRYEQFGRSLPKSGVRAVARVTKDTPQHAIADVQLIDDRGQVVAILHGYECVIDENLNQAFRRNG